MDSAGRRALVVGLGISGIATALRLRQIGWTPVIVEPAAARRSGGSFIALFGAGRAAAARLGILDGLTDHDPDGGSYDIDRAGRRRPGLSFKDFPGQPWMMTRGDVEEAGFAALPPDVEIRYATVPTRIEQDAAGVAVTLADTTAGTETTERFDLVVGADGLRSTVRRLVFGPDERHLRPMNCMAVAYQLPGALPGHDLGAALDALESADQVLFDSVEQVRMDRWHRGRVVLVGDAAWCVTLYAGMGASTGLAGADLLGTMLARHPYSVTEALTRWERHLRPCLHDLQGNGLQMRSLFVPITRLELVRRQLLVRAGKLPVISRFFLRWREKAGRMKETDFAHPDLAGFGPDRLAHV